MWFQMLHALLCKLFGGVAPAWLECLHKLFGWG